MTPPGNRDPPSPDRNRLRPSPLYSRGEADGRSTSTAVPTDDDSGSDAPAAANSDSCRRPRAFSARRPAARCPSDLSTSAGEGVRLRRLCGSYREPDSEPPAAPAVLPAAVARHVTTRHQLWHDTARQRAMPAAEHVADVHGAERAEGSACGVEDAGVGAGPFFEGRGRDAVADRQPCSPSEPVCWMFWIDQGRTMAGRRVPWQRAFRLPSTRPSSPLRRA